MNTLTETPRMLRLPSRLWVGLTAWFTLAVTIGTGGLTADPLMFLVHMAIAVKLMEADAGSPPQTI